jgi:hypothetical protein
MKCKGSMTVLVLALIFVISGVASKIHAFGFTEDQRDIMNLQTFVISDFGDEIDQTNGIVWVAKYSRFAKPSDYTKQMSDPDTNSCYLSYQEGKPLGLPHQVDAKQKWCLGIKAQFLKQGFNWIEIYPLALKGGILDASGKPMSTIVNPSDNSLVDNFGGKASNKYTDYVTNFNLDGVVKSLDMWVWGGNYKYWMEFHLQDYKGFLHRLSAGDIKYVGWMNMRTKIPEYIPQAESHVPFLKNLKLILIKLWGYPTERVDQFYVYFDYMQVQTDVYRQRFNGDDLAESRW